MPTLPGQSTDQIFTVAELAEAAARLLERAPAPSDVRVAAVPDTRTLRYYQSIGVMDRPLRYEGRQAIYGYRHLLQAVAVKLLQGQGYTLAQVQRSLQGTPTAQLESAVTESLDVPLPKPRTRGRALVSAELAPGVVVTVDPALISNPEALFAAFSSLLDSKGASL